jgi:hypothetical protein
VRIAPLVALVAGLTSASFHVAAAPKPDDPLQFRIAEGNVTNAFYQQGPLAAHLLLSDGTQPRILVAFPAGNSGVGVWFEQTAKPVRWKLGDVKGITRTDERGRTLRGIVAEATVDSPLTVHDAVLGSVRVLRDYQLNGTYPPTVKASATVAGNSVSWARPRLDGGPGYSLSIELRNGDIHPRGGMPPFLSPARAGEPMTLRLTALTGETPLTPLGKDRLLKNNARSIHFTRNGDIPPEGGMSPFPGGLSPVHSELRSRQVLTFLSYEEKFLAGSWRFDTYFGRDTLMSLRLLMPALQPEAIERGIMSVLQRLAPDGEVAHEEDIGEFAVLRHRQRGEPTNDAPIYDYKMIDDDFMLAPVAAAYLIDQSQGRSRAKAFLARTLPSGERVGTALLRNFSYVTESARPFSAKPEARNLIGLKPGLNVGNWRDSEDGLAGGRYPFDVNAVLVPAAMTAIAELIKSGVLKPYLDAEQVRVLAPAQEIADEWTRKAPSLFRVRIANDEARRRIATYAAKLGVGAKAAVESIGNDDITVNAIALDAHYSPIPVVNSDGGFALLLQDPPTHEVEQLVQTMLRPFPAGLLTDAGLLVANPVFADVNRQRMLDRNAYHGTVTWSWQQALLAAGLDRQLARHDLPETTLEQLRSARERLWSVIEKTRGLRSSELWSWRYAGGKFQPVPFGQGSGDADESNAAQLWSTVYLAIPPPHQK